MKISGENAKEFGSAAAAQLHKKLRIAEVSSAPYSPWQNKSEPMVYDDNCDAAGFVVQVYGTRWHGHQHLTMHGKPGWCITVLRGNGKDGETHRLSTVGLCYVWVVGQEAQEGHKESKSQHDRSVCRQLFSI